MPTNLTRVLFVAVAALAVGPAGCGNMKAAADRAKATNDLKELGLAYFNFQDAESRPPKSFEELNKKSPVSPGCAQATVVWGAGAGPMCRDGAASEIVLGWRPSPGTTNVLVLYCDASVRQLTAAEFDAAQKAKPLAP